MEIVLALAAVVGTSLIAVPRLRRRTRGRVRADAGKQWTTTAAARRRRSGAAAGGSRSGWAPRTAAAATSGTTAIALATEPCDEWDDDLDWGGETAVAAPPAAPGAPLPESDLDWHLPGHERGTGDAVVEPAEEPRWDDWAEAGQSANGNGVAPPVDVPPAAAGAVETPSRASRHHDVRTDAPGEASAGEASAGDASAGDASAGEAPGRGREAPHEVADEADWDWEPVVTRGPAASLATAPATPARDGRIRARGRKLNPLVLVALYAAFGIGVIVIAVTVVSGAVSGSGTNRTPRTSAAVQPTPEPTAPAASGTADAEAKRLQQAFIDQSAAVLAQVTSAARDARAAARRARAARRKARAARRRAAARRAAARRAVARRAVPAPTRQVPATPAPTMPTVRATPAAPRGGGGGGGGGCEFCIG